MSNSRQLIILFYQHITREVRTLEQLKNAIERKSLFDVVLLSIDFEWHKAVRLARKHKTAAIVVPWAYSAENYKLFVPFQKSNPGVVIVNLHSEQISSPYSEALLLPSAECVKTGVVHFVWGSYFAEKLKNCGVPRELIVETGNIRNDEMGFAELTKIEMADKYNLDENKRWILFAENRDWVYQWDEAYASEYVSRGGNPSQAEYRYGLSKRALEASLREMDGLGPSFFNDFELIYRPHPGSSSDKRPAYPVRTIADGSIYEWLAVSDLVIVWSSTTIFEADAMGVPAIVYEPVENDPLFRIDGTAEYITITSLEDLNESLIEEARLLRDEKKTYRRYYGKIDGNSVERIANAIVALLKETPQEYHPQLVDVGISNVKKRVFETLTLLFSKTGLLTVFKFPRSAYDHNRDIPWPSRKKV